MNSSDFIRRLCIANLCIPLYVLAFAVAMFLPLKCEAALDTEILAENISIGDFKYNIRKEYSQPHNVPYIRASVMGLADGLDASSLAEVRIPGYVFYNDDAILVDRICAHAFDSNSSLTGELFVPATVDAIEEYAFHMCDNLTYVEMPSVRWIGKAAFKDCTQLSGQLPNAIESVEEEAFMNCSSLNGSLILSNCYQIQSYAFYGCSGLDGVLSLEGSTVDRIGDYAFAGCNKLSGDVLIQNVTLIGNNAFEGCSSLDGRLELGDALYWIGQDAFSGCSNLTGELLIPNSVTVFGSGAFRDCSGFIGELTLGEGLKDIGGETFRGCSGLSGVLRIPNSVEGIWDGAFYGCKNITEVELPTGLKTISSRAFVDCDQISKVVCDAVTPPVIRIDDWSPYYAFDTYVHENATLFIPGGSLSNYEEAYEWKEFLHKTVITTGLILTPSEVSIKVGEVVKVEAVYTPFDATDKIVEWQSSRPQVADVDAAGMVTAYSLGETVITAVSKSGFSASSNIVVVETPVSEVILNKNVLELPMDESFQLKATVLPENSTDKSLTWMSDAEDVVSVDDNGQITAKALGTATIIVTAKSGVKAQCEVTVVSVPAAAISLNRDEAIIRVNELLHLEAIVYPYNTTDKNVKWHSTDKDIATVDTDGLVTGKLAGVVTITATTASGVSASCLVTVLPREIAPITITRSEEFMVIMDGEQAHMWVKVEGGYPEGLSFEWRNNGSLIGNAATLTVTGHSSGISQSTEAYTLRVVDVCDGVTMFDETYIFNVETWPRPAYTTSTEVDVQKIREGNTLTVSADVPDGGYRNEWVYQWTLNSTLVSNSREFTHVMTMTSGKQQATENAEFALTATNFGPDGTLWGEAIAETMPVIVYRRPLTPSHLLRKGDGNTHTLIALSPLSDAELTQLGYTFVYGYTDGSGLDHVVASTAKRYCRIDKEVFDNESCHKWCYTEWRYTDGSVVSSGKRYLDGATDENFDASVFSGSTFRKSLRDYSDADNWIVTDVHGVTVTVDNEEETLVEMISSSGILVRSISLPAREYASVRFDLTDLHAGVYIVAVMSADTRVVKKVIIR